MARWLLIDGWETRVTSFYETNTYIAANGHREFENYSNKTQ